MHTLSSDNNNNTEHTYVHIQNTRYIIHIIQLTAKSISVLGYKVQATVHHIQPTDK